MNICTFKNSAKEKNKSLDRNCSILEQMCVTFVINGCSVTVVNDRTYTHTKERTNQSNIKPVTWSLPTSKSWSLVKQHGWPSTNTQLYTDVSAPLLSLNLWRPPELLPSHVLKHLKTPFTFPLTLPHCFVTLPKGTPLAWPCTEPPTHTYT